MDLAGGYENMSIIVLRYSIGPTPFGYLFMKKYQPTKYVHLRLRSTGSCWRKPEVKPIFTSACGQDENIAYCPTCLSLTVQKFTILEYFEASCFERGGGELREYEIGPNI